MNATVITLLTSLAITGPTTSGDQRSTPTQATIELCIVSAIKDIVGNPLRSNQSTDESVFTILLPGVDLDFGDAPDPFSGAGRYPTLFENNGARHVITGGFGVNRSCSRFSSRERPCFCFSSSMSICWTASEACTGANRWKNPSLNFRSRPS